jgi:hypothetical protein
VASAIIDVSIFDSNADDPVSPTWF